MSQNKFSLRMAPILPEDGVLDAASKITSQARGFYGFVLVLSTPFGTLCCLNQQLIADLAASVWLTPTIQGRVIEITG